MDILTHRLLSSFHRFHGRFCIMCLKVCFFSVLFTPCGQKGVAGNTSLKKLQDSGSTPAFTSEAGTRDQATTCLPPVLYRAGGQALAAKASLTIETQWKLHHSPSVCEPLSRLRSTLSSTASAAVEKACCLIESCL